MTFALLAATAGGAQAQWRPTGPLAAVPVIRECDETGGDIAVSRLDPPTIYVCPRVVALVAKRLMRAGFKRVRPLRGGIDAWIEKGYAVEVA